MAAVGLLGRLAHLKSSAKKLQKWQWSSWTFAAKSTHIDKKKSGMPGQARLRVKGFNQLD